MTVNTRTVAFVLAASDQGTLIVNRFDRHQNFGVGFQLLETASYTPREIALGARLIELRREVGGDGVVVVDAGANIGVHTVVWARRMTGWGSVIAIEAQERIFYALAGNVAINNLLNAKAIWAAASSTTGTMRIPTPSYVQPCSFGSLELVKRAKPEFIGQIINYQDEALTDVRCMTLDSLELARVDFVKIDVEGMELDVLEGAKETLTRCRPVVSAEIIKSDRAALVRFLESRGYIVRTFGMNLLAIHAGDAVLSRIIEIPLLRDRFSDAWARARDHVSAVPRQHRASLRHRSAKYMPRV